ncbi:MAG: right-handed parallel beta-helix repeat-containing protein [Mangrovibacterium sp.]
MKTSYNLLIIFILLFILSALTGKKEISFYVSTKGNDKNTGSISQPFRSIERAREAVRSFKRGKSRLPSGGITVYIREGTYPVHQTFRLTGEDSGTEECPVVYRSYLGEEVHFIGGEAVSNFHPLADKAAKARIDKKYHDKIWQADLKTLGISDFGNIKPTGFGHDYKPAALELFFNGEPMILARYPNSGEWMKIVSVPQSGKLVNPGEQGVMRFGLPSGSHYGRFEYSGDRPSSWTKGNDIWLHGYWTWDWADSYIKIDTIDTKKKEFIIAEPHHIYGYVRDQRYYALNILEELDSPGEWYLNRHTGKLYFWPPSPVKQGVAMVSVLENLMVTMDSTENVTIEDIILECSRGEAIKIKGGTHNLIRGCTIRDMGTKGVTIEGGTYNGIWDCDIYNMGDGGIIIQGGDWKTLVASHNFAINNHIHHYSRINKTYRPAINLDGVGNLLSHNYIHDAPHVGVSFGGNENILEYNEIHSIAQETGDVGAFYTGRDWTARGNIIRYNYFHNLYGPGQCGVNAVYLDDAASGTSVYGNVFYKTGKAVFVGGGHDNIAENNVFIDCDPSIHLDARGMNWARESMKRGGNYGLYEKLEAINYKNSPYSIRYPLLAKILDWGDPCSPKGNVFRTNLSYGGKWKEIFDEVEQVVIENNYIEKEVPPYINAEQGKLYPENGQILEDIGFQKIPFDSIGLYIDEFRKTLPGKVTPKNIYQ